MSIQSVAQSPNPGEQVALFMLDLTFVNGPIYYFCQGAKEVEGVTFGGQYYTPVDIDFSELETNGGGVMPQPKMKVSNTNAVFQAVVNTYGDALLGCTVKRIRTFSRFLDGQSEADPTAYYGPDVFRIERKATENPIFIEFELSSSIDQEGKLLPGRQVIRDTCLWRYRTWNPDTQTFTYTKAQCPYVGSQYWDQFDQPTTAANDRPSRSLTCCELRFGAGNPLPFGGFPGVGRVRA